MRLCKNGFRLDGDDVGDKSPAGGQVVEAGVEQTGSGQSAADEDRRRPFGAIESVGRLAAYVDADAESRGVEFDVAAPSFVAFERDRPATPSAETPLDADAARPRADVP